MSNFITNTDSKDIKKRLIELIQKSDELKFLVGFFYFSGINSLKMNELLFDGYLIACGSGTDFTAAVSG